MTRPMALLMLAAACGGSTAENLNDDEDLTGAQATAVVVYSEDGWTELAEAFKADPTPGATYYMHLPAGANDKTWPRGPDEPAKMRARGSHFKAMAEFHWGAWSQQGGSWYDKGVEFRRRMLTQGYLPAKGDTWAINELPSSMRRDAQARQNARDAIRGLYEGPAGSPKLKGAVFIEGVGSNMVNFSEYKPNLESWLADSAFWKQMSTDVRFWGQETYTDPGTACVAGTTVAKKSAAINSFIEHLPELAAAGGSRASAARSFLSKAYVPLLNGAFRNPAYQTDGVPLDEMKHFVGNQIYASRASANKHDYAGGRVGLGWTFRRDQVNGSEEADLAKRTASALHYAYDSNDGAAAGACSPSHAYTWCQCSLPGAQFNSGWSTFSHW